MNKEEALARVKQLEEAAQQSVANHNVLIGRLAEAKEFLEKLDAPIVAQMKEIEGEIV